MSLGDHSDSYEVLPDEIKSILRDMKSRHFLFWKHESLFGLNCQNKTVYIDLNDFKDIELCYWSRAKGPGGIEIMVWPKELSNFVGTEIKVVDCGPDY